MLWLLAMKSIDRSALFGQTVSAAVFSLALVAFSFFASSVFSSAAVARTDEPTRAEMIKYAREFYTSLDYEDPNLEGPLVWKSIEEKGWPDSLKPFQARMKPGRSYLALYKKLPLTPMDMRSPNRFKTSMASNEIFGKSSIGHMTVAWSCDADGKRNEGIAASTGESGQTDKMTTAGWGLTAFVSTFTDGRLQNAHSIQHYFAEEFIDHVEADIEPPPMVPLVLEVPTEECERVRQFVKDYLHHPNKPYKKFGMLPDPLKFEGAGCGSFAVSALSLSATWAPITNTFWRTFGIPNRLLGRLTRDQLPDNVEPAAIANTASEIVSISRAGLIMRDWDSGKAAYHLHFVDPELTIFALRKWTELATDAKTAASTAAATDPKSARPSKYQRLHLENLKRTLYFPARPVDSFSPVSEKDSGTHVIDEKFDVSFSLVSRAVRDTASLLARKGMQPQLVNFPFGVGVLVANPN